jgi:hypothetical protein
MRGHFIQPASGESQQPVFTAICSPLIVSETDDTTAEDNTTIFKTVNKLDMSFIDINKRLAVDNHNYG